MDRNHLNKFEIGPTKDHSWEVWSKSNQWFRRRCCLKIVDGRRRRRTVGDHNSSPCPFGSGELKIYFQNSSHGGHFGGWIRTILAIFDLQINLMLPTKFQVNWPFSSTEEAKKIDFQDGHHGSHLGFPIGTIFAIFDLQVTPMLLTKFQVNWPRGSGEAK